MLSQWLQQARNGRSVWLSDVRQDCEVLSEHVAVTMQLTLTDGTRRDFSLPIPRWEGAEQRQFVKQYVTACVFNTLSALSGREMAFYLDLRETEAAALLGELDNIFQGHETARSGYGKVVNIAFAVSAAFVFGDHLGFTAGFAPEMIGPMIVGKLVGGVSAIAVAMWLTAKEEKS